MHPIQFERLRVVHVGSNHVNHNETAGVSRLLPHSILRVDILSHSYKVLYEKITFVWI